MALRGDSTLRQWHLLIGGTDEQRTTAYDERAQIQSKRKDETFVVVGVLTYGGKMRGREGERGR